MIRINHSDDVPHYDIISSKAQDSFNRHSGLFGCPEGFYYSVGLRPDNIRANLKLTKIDYPSKLIMKQHAVKLIVLGCANGEEKNKLAEMVHNLRRANLTFEASTSQPFPLHLMNAIKKYWQAQVVTTKNELELEGDEYDLDDRIERDIILRSDIPKKKYGILRKKNV